MAPSSGTRTRGPPTPSLPRLARSTLTLVPLLGVHEVVFAPVTEEQAEGALRFAKLAFEIFLSSFQVLRQTGCRGSTLPPRAFPSIRVYHFLEQPLTGVRPSDFILSLTHSLAHSCTGQKISGLEWDVGSSGHGGRGPHSPPQHCLRMRSKGCGVDCAGAESVFDTFQLHGFLHLWVGPR